ncbi:MAG: tetratricopeptide repeat protein [Gammaproteobacteria bacterium]
MKLNKTILIIFFLCTTACSEKLDPYEAFAVGEYENAKQQLIPLAEQNDLKAITHLAAVYQIERNYTEAVELYTKAALKDHVPAQYNLGVMAYQGKGMEQDNLMSYGWLDHAREQGHPKASDFINGFLRFEMTPNAAMQAKEEVKKLIRAAAD